MGGAGCSKDDAQQSGSGGATQNDAAVDVTASDGPGPDVVAAKAPAAAYVLSNNPAGNALVSYARAADGSLSGGTITATGGKGTGVGLGDQGALAFDAASNLFFAVNAGDNSISMLSLNSDGAVTLLDNVSSGGISPISITEHGGWVYVVNSGDAPAGGTAHAANIAGFKVTGNKLMPLNLTQPLSAAQPMPAQIQFTPDGTLLIVTEKGTSMIDAFPVPATGMAGPGKFQASAGMTPFGFEFAGNVLIVSEAAGAAANATSMSSYTWTADGSLTAKTSHLATTRTAACWVTVSGKYAYATNTQTFDVTSFRVEADGAITLLQATAGMTSPNPIDEQATADGYLYVLSAKASAINTFKIGLDGALTKSADFSLQLTTAAGLIAR
jgi:6-phosphogluconolactonase (cycloisomerase 2 family)